MDGSGPYEKTSYQSAFPVPCVLRCSSFQAYLAKHVSSRMLLHSWLDEFPSEELSEVRVPGVEDEDHRDEDALRREVVKGVDPEVVGVDVDEACFHLVDVGGVDVGEEDEKHKQDLGSEAETGSTEFHV